MELIIMNKDTVVAVYENDNLTILNPDLAPHYLVRTHDVEGWLSERAIDSHRPNSRLLKKALRLAQKDDASTVISVNAATITDTYWVKDKNSTQTYDDIRFNDDYFAELALTGSYDSFNKVAFSDSKRTPELTNIGSYEKCWRLIDNQWFMYKTSNDNEMFSELFAYVLGKKLNMNMAEYKASDGCVVTKDFTNNASVIFEPMHSYVGDEEDYSYNLDIIKRLCTEAVEDYVRMVFLDTVIANPDRHTYNYGFIRGVDNGKIIGLAPNFDNNLSLISRGYPKYIERNKDILIDLFVELIQQNPELVKYIPVLKRKTVIECAEQVQVDVNKAFVVDYVMNGYNNIVQKLDFKYITVNELVFSKLPDNIKDRLSFIKENSDYIIRVQAKDYTVLQNTIKSIGRSKARQ